MKCEERAQCIGPSGCILLVCDVSLRLSRWSTLHTAGKNGIACICTWPSDASWEQINVARVSTVTPGTRHTSSHRHACTSYFTVCDSCDRRVWVSDACAVWAVARGVTHPSPAPHASASPAVASPYPLTPDCNQTPESRLQTYLIHAASIHRHNGHRPAPHAGNALGLSYLSASDSSRHHLIHSNCTWKT